MWSEEVTPFNFDQKVYLRTTVLAERLWHEKIDINKSLNNIATRLTAQAKRLRARGFKVAPVTVGLCEEKDMSICFQ